MNKIFTINKHVLENERVNVKEVLIEDINFNITKEELINQSIELKSIEKQNFIFQEIIKINDNMVSNKNHQIINSIFVSLIIIIIFTIFVLFVKNKIFKLSNKRKEEDNIG